MAGRFSLDLTGLQQLRAQAPRAIARALNRSIGSAKTVMVREVSGDLGLKQSDVRELIGTREATPERQVAQLTASFKRIPLIDFHARGPEPSRGKGGGVQYRIGSRAGRRPQAFIATMRSGHRGVFQRRSTRRLPIRELKGPSIAHVFGKHVEVGLARGQEQLIKNLQSELSYAMRGTP